MSEISIEETPKRNPHRMTKEEIEFDEKSRQLSILLKLYTHKDKYNYYLTYKTICDNEPLCYDIINGHGIHNSYLLRLEKARNAKSIQCVCGSNIKNFQKYITQHNNTKKHIEFVKNKTE